MSWFTVPNIPGRNEMGVFVREDGLNVDCLKIYEKQFRNPT